MAKKNDNTLLFAALAIGGYFLWKHAQTPVAPGVQVTLPPPGNTSAPGSPTLALSASPTGNIAVNPGNGPSNAVVNTTNMTTATVIDQGIAKGNAPLLQSGQFLATNNDGTLILDRGGVPLVYEQSAPDSLYYKFESGNYPGSGYNSNPDANHFAKQFLNGPGDCM